MKNINPYEMIVTTLELTADQAELIKIAVEAYQNRCVSRGESITAEEILEKLDETSHY